MDLSVEKLHFLKEKFKVKVGYEARIIEKV